MALNFPIALNNIEELSEADQEEVFQIQEDMYEHADTKVTEDYEEAWDGDRHCKRLTDRWETNETLGYQTHYHREYRYPLIHKAFGALASSSRILDVI